MTQLAHTIFGLLWFGGCMYLYTFHGPLWMFLATFAFVVAMIVKERDWGVSE